MSELEVERAVDAVRRGRLAVIPTDTVYGLACSPHEGDAVRALSDLKGRSDDRPIALVATTVDLLLELVPELTGRAALAVHALLPGPYTLVLPNPARRFDGLTGGTPETIGVRVPVLDGPGGAVLGRLGVVAATSANHHGGPDPRRLDDVPADILDACATVDGGELPGVPSTVLDLTAPAPRVLRAGAVATSEALARVNAALAR